LVEAEPLDERHTIRAFFQRKKIRCMMCILCLVFLLLTVGTIYAMTGFVFDREGEEVGNNDIDLSNAPSSAPTSEGDLQLEYFVRVAVPDYTRDALKWKNSPQTKALQWLQNNTNLESYPISRRLQRFALATLYFSTSGGRHWIQDDGWMSDEDECTWFSSEKDTPVCKDGELRVMALQSNGLRGTIVPEISLLSSLELLRLQQNFLTGFMPTTLGQLSSMREIRLCKFWGSRSVGDEFAFAGRSSLTQFATNAVDNYLSGTIPAELSLLSNMELLDLGTHICNYVAVDLIPTCGFALIFRISVQNTIFLPSCCRPHLASSQNWRSFSWTAILWLGLSRRNSHHWRI
jgi:hypothetical protein